MKALLKNCNLYPPRKILSGTRRRVVYPRPAVYRRPIVIHKPDVMTPLAKLIL